MDGYYLNNNYDGVLGVEAEQALLAQTPDSLIDQRCRQVLANKDRLNWTIHRFGPMYIPRKGDIVKITPEMATIHKLILEWETGKKLKIDRNNNRVMADGKLFTTHRFEHNYYFMAGDNVMNSVDSRYHGPVPEEFIIGIVEWVI